MAASTWVATDTWRPLLRYAAAANVMKYFFDAPGRLLVVGLGGLQWSRSTLATVESGRGRDRSGRD
jgi:hypothetical protein